MLLLGLLSAAIARCRQRCRYRADMAASQLPAALGALQTLSGRLVVADAVDRVHSSGRRSAQAMLGSLRADVSPHTAARAIAAFEA